MMVSSGPARTGATYAVGKTAPTLPRLRFAATLPPVAPLPRPNPERGGSWRSSHSSSSQTGSQNLSYPSHLRSPTPYDIFHLPRTTSPAQIKARYYDLVRTLHPDRVIRPGTSEQQRQKATSEFKLVLQAYHLLKDPHKKNLYDRSGIGWDAKRGAANSGAGSYHEWSDAMRRNGRPGGSPHGWDRSGWHPHSYDPRYTRATDARDKYGWQTWAASDSTFYGFTSNYHPNAQAHKPRYTSNGIFFSSIFVLTWLMAAVQYKRLENESQKAIQRADKAHLDAAKSLNEARELARSTEGRQRYEALRRRAREAKIIEELARHEGGQADWQRQAEDDNPWGIGHGGPSGKDEAQKRFELAKSRMQLQEPLEARTSSLPASLEEGREAAVQGMCKGLGPTEAIHQ
ncbi:hypothetical protein ACQY0O_006859 [Thecaphora frezii]